MRLVSEDFEYQPHGVVLIQFRSLKLEPLAEAPRPSSGFVPRISGPFLTGRYCKRLQLEERKNSTN